MDDDNFATVLECFFNVLSLKVAQGATKKVPMLDYLVQESTSCNLSYHTVWCQHSVVPILITAAQDKWSLMEVQKAFTQFVQWFIVCQQSDYERQWVWTDICHGLLWVMLISNGAEKWSSWMIVPTLLVGWDAICNNMRQCQVYDSRCSWQMAPWDIVWLKKVYWMQPREK